MTEKIFSIYEISGLLKGSGASCVNDLIFWLKDIKFRHQTQFGSKAANLGVIARELKTPAGFCLNSVAYTYALDRAGVLKQIVSLAEEVQSSEINEITKVSDEIYKIIINISLPPEIDKNLRDEYEKLISKRAGVKVAVRSSATAEDLPSASFAGQLESYLNIESFTELIESIKKCWASLWTPRAIHYRHQKGIGQRNIGMAVIVQEMVPAQVAGVMFTANPVTNSRKEFYIEAVRGLGEGLVLGEKNADRYIVRKEGVFIKSIESVENESYLNEFQIKTLADAGAKLEFMYQEYQDIEWAYYKGDIYILQTRPITTLEDEEPELIPVEKMTSIQKEVWTNVNERFPEPILPIDGIVAKIYYLSLFSAYRSLGFSVPYVDWQRVEAGMFPELFVPPAIKQGPLRLLKLSKTMKWDILKEWEDNEKLFDKYLKLLKDKRLREFPLEIIMEYVEDALKDFQRVLTFRYLLYIQYGTLYNGLSRLMILLFGSEGKRLQQDLVAGYPQITIEVNEKLVELAHGAKNMNKVKESMINTDADKIREKLMGFSVGQEFLKQFDDFLDKYGDRELSQGLGGLAAPTWRETPEIVLEMLKGILRELDNPRQTKQNMTERRQQAEIRLQELMSRGVAKILPMRSVLNKLIDSAQKYNAFRENSHFYLTQAMTVFRTLFLEMGNRLVRLGLVDDENDIMYFTFFEVKDLLYQRYSKQKISKLELEEIIRGRKQKQERRRKKWLTRNVSIEATGKEVLKGVGASSGIVSGKCRIITDPREFERLSPGDILVARYTNPAWTPVFSYIGGLVVEYGSTVSHAAIIAREYGIPAVMGVSGATSVLKDGETIIIDGANGYIQKDAP